MSEGQCGNCDHYHYLMQRKVDCIVDGELHDTGNSCDDYKKRVTGKSREARQKESLEARRRKEAKEAEQRQREFDEKMAEKPESTIESYGEQVYGGKQHSLFPVLYWELSGH